VFGEPTADSAVAALSMWSVTCCEARNAGTPSALANAAASIMIAVPAVSVGETSALTVEFGAGSRPNAAPCTGGVIRTGFKAGAIAGLMWLQSWKAKPRKCA
jgi:hypothetical protein